MDLILLIVELVFLTVAVAVRNGVELNTSRSEPPNPDNWGSLVTLIDKNDQILGTGTFFKVRNKHNVSKSQSNVVITAVHVCREPNDWRKQGMKVELHRTGVNHRGILHDVVQVMCFPGSYCDVPGEHRERNDLAIIVFKNQKKFEDDENLRTPAILEKINYNELRDCRFGGWGAWGAYLNANPPKNPTTLEKYSAYVPKNLSWINNLEIVTAKNKGALGVDYDINKFPSKFYAVPQDRTSTTGPGDSGGPLICKMKRGTAMIDVIVGLLSAGTDLEQLYEEKIKDYRSIFQKIEGKWVQWIKDCQLKENPGAESRCYSQKYP